MYHVSAQGVDERMIHYRHYYYIFGVARKQKFRPPFAENSEQVINKVLKEISLNY